MVLFEARNVTKQYLDKLALNNVSISISEGCIYGLLGPNGAGKTTLLRIINQITGPDSGELFFNGKKLSSEDIKTIGYLPEERGLYKKMRVGEQALYFAQLKGLTRSEAMKRLKYWFEKLNIIEWWNKKVEELSKGMQQKIQFIITVLHNPTLLIFDEPFSGFDPINTNIIKNEIISLSEQGTTIILSTHNMESVEELCDNITLINNGKSILEGTVESIRKKWSSNEYELVFEGEATINNNMPFKVLDSRRDNEKHIVRIMSSNGATSNDILKKAMLAGKILSFNPFLPSMNEIFIRVVENRN